MKRKYLLLAGLAFGAAGLLWWKFKSRNESASSNNNTNTSTEDTEMLPRGYRNNNPLNIRFKSYNNWQGKKLPNTDGAFEQFVSMDYGYRAALYLLRNYVLKDGLTRLNEIISKWAPANENHTNLYIDFVAKTNGWPTNKIINAHSQSDMTKLAYAMSIFENGRNPMPNTQAINNGWNLL